MVMLSALGGWLRPAGKWDPPTMIKPRLRREVIDVRDILEYTGFVEHAAPPDLEAPHVRVASEPVVERPAEFVRERDTEPFDDRLTELIRADVSGVVSQSLLDKVSKTGID